MKPSQIRVFDGLRLTTDHVNHLQGAFASGCEDFRQILGLGKPQSGLEVSVQDDGSVTIQPGVAFDFQKNRLACDNPLQLPLNFGRQDQAKFVCLKYEQVEDGVVEGHPTMIWDSCSAVVRDSPPDPKENLVALAIIVRDAEGKLQVRRHGECAPPPIGVTGPIAAAPPKPPGGATVSAPAANAAPCPGQTKLMGRERSFSCVDGKAGSSRFSMTWPQIRPKWSPQKRAPSGVSNEMDPSECPGVW